jgi:pimeloyl-ACP methyl ester carboxylesterase
MNYKKIIFHSSKKLVGNLFIPEEKFLKAVLILHGGGSSNKERFKELQEMLMDHTIASFAFDFRGVGESEGTFEEGSLNNRLADAKAAVEELSKYCSLENIVVIGCSMGGHVAVRLVNIKPQIRTLILLYAGIYGEEAESKLLNDTFTQVLRKKQSWKDSPVFKILENYTGKILVIYGRKDTIIPKELKNILRILVKVKGKYIELKDAGHLILSPQTALEEKEKVRSFNEIIEYIIE